MAPIPRPDDQGVPDFGSYDTSVDLSAPHDRERSTGEAVPGRGSWAPMTMDCALHDVEGRIHGDPDGGLGEI